MATAPVLVASCFDDVRGSGPGVELLTPQASIDVSAGDSADVVVQVLDANGAGVNDAYVTFTRADTRRLIWLDTAPNSYAATVKTQFSTAGGLHADGVASVRIAVPSSAPVGNADILAVLKEPASSGSAIAGRVNVHVMAPPDAGASAEPAEAEPSGPGATDGSDAGLEDAE